MEWFFYYLLIDEGMKTTRQSQSHKRNFYPPSLYDVTLKFSVNFSVGPITIYQRRRTTCYGSKAAVQYPLKLKITS